MPRKAVYIKENMHVRPYRVWYDAMKDIDWKQPIVIVGRQKNGELYVASTDSGKLANSLLAKAMNFLKVGYERKTS
jgi:hypothetical protein